MPGRSFLWMRRTIWSLFPPAAQPRIISAAFVKEMANGPTRSWLCALRPGKFVWGFQVVHHDLWDYDVAAQPTLIRWKDGTPAVVINTKMGHVFVLNRLTGAPLLPVEERRVPQSDIAGEESSPTQPFSTISLVPEKFEADDAWGPKPDDISGARRRLRLCATKESLRRQVCAARCRRPEMLEA